MEKIEVFAVKDLSDIPVGEPLFTVSAIVALLDNVHSPVECGPDCPCMKIRNALHDFEMLAAIKKATPS